MIGVDVVGLVTVLTASDPAVCDQVALADLRCDLAAGAWVARQLRGPHRVAGRRLGGERFGDPAAVVLADRGRRSGRAAREAARRGSVCADLPGLFDALASGVVSSGHVDAVARLAGRLDDAGRAELRDLEPAIVGSATRTVVEVFEREMRDLERILTRQSGTNRLQDQKQRRNVKRWVDTVTGMCHTHLELDPEADARVAAVFDAAIATERAEPDDGRTLDQLQADVMVELITGARTTDTRVPECSVLIDLDTLLHGLHDASVCETADGQHLPPDVIRRMCCEADIIPIVLNGDHVPIDVGRARRLATREQRHALQAMYTTCGHPHCEVRFAACRIHHVDWWDHHGPTDLANLVPLCARHHHLVHEGSWTLTLKPDRTITLRRPDGSLAHEGTTTDRTPPRPDDSENPDHPRRAARTGNAPPERSASP